MRPAGAILLASNAPPAGGAAVTWNPARKSSLITLSAGNLRQVASSTSRGVAATLSRELSTANHYFEIATVAGNRIPIGLIGAAVTNFEQSVSTMSPATSLFSFTGFFYWLATGTGFQASGGTVTAANFEPPPFVACCYVLNGNIYYGVVGSAGGQWFDPTSNTFKATYNLCTPFVTGASGLYAPGTGSGSAGGTTSDGRFAAAAMTGVIPSGGVAWE